MRKPAKSVFVDKVESYENWPILCGCLLFSRRPPTCAYSSMQGSEISDQCSYCRAAERGVENLRLWEDSSSVHFFTWLLGHYTFLSLTCPGLVCFVASVHSLQILNVKGWVQALVLALSVSVSLPWRSLPVAADISVCGPASQVCFFTQIELPNWTLGSPSVMLSFHFWV